MKRLIVRCIDRMIFEIDKDSLEAKHCSRYDAHCFNDPDSNIEYIEFTDWVKMRNAQWDKQQKEYYRSRYELR